MNIWTCKACDTKLELEDTESEKDFYSRVMIHQNEHIQYSVFLIAQNTNPNSEKITSRSFK